MQIRDLIDYDYNDTTTTTSMARALLIYMQFFPQ